MVLIEPECVQNLPCHLDISKWETENVISMSSMFEGAYEFNQQITNWKVEKVQNMKYMFREARSFNHWLGNSLYLSYHTIYLYLNIPFVFMM